MKYDFMHLQHSMTVFKAMPEKCVISYRFKLNVNCIEFAAASLCLVEKNQVSFGFNILTI